MLPSSFNGWYPIAFSKDIVSHTLSSFNLLDEPLILYRNAQQEPVCLQDRCPHRSTPLSLGRLVNGVVECRYHGWQFNSDGQCTRIPAIQSDNAFPPNACVPKRLTQEKHGFIWIHQGNTDIGPLPTYTDELFSVENNFRFDYSIDVAIPHELMIENLLDPAHLPFAHHGTLSKRDKAAPIGFDVQHHQTHIQGTATVTEPQQNKKIHFYFLPPHCVYFDVDFGNKGMRQIHYCIPLTPDTMRLNSIFFYKNMPWLNWVPFINSIQKRMSKKIVNQDIAMLQGQHHNINQGAKAWNQAINADKMAMAYRHWLNQSLQTSPWFTGYKD